MTRPVAARLLAVVAAVLLAGGCAGQPAPDPAAALAVDCADPDAEMARLVCADPQLVELNHRLADGYHRALTGPDVAGLQTAQRGWTAHRDDCLQASDVGGCLRAAYQTRLAELLIDDPATVPSATGVFDRCTDPSDASVEPLTVEFYNEFDPAAAVLSWRGDREILFVQPSASGSRYARPGVQYWEHQGDATIDFYGNEFRCATR